MSIYRKKIKKYKKVIDNEERGVVVFRRYLPQEGQV